MFKRKRKLEKELRELCREWRTATESLDQDSADVPTLTHMDGLIRRIHTVNSSIQMIEGDIAFAVYTFLLISAAAIGMVVLPACGILSGHPM